MLDNLNYGRDTGGSDGSDNGVNAVLERPMGDVIEHAELDGVLSRLPQGLATTLGEAGCFVSGGEGQRVRIGRGLSQSDARLVILDEAFRGLERGQRKTCCAGCDRHTPRQQFSPRCTTSTRRWNLIASW